MDQRLVAWGRAVKARRKLKAPVLWLFTDAARLPDPLGAIARLPQGLCGVVLRDDALPGRAALAADVARLCRQRRLVLSVAGDWRLAARLGAWVHLRRGKGAGWRGMPCTASAHDLTELRRGRARGALVFLSPVFPTASHPGAVAVGVLRWAALARGRKGVLALGGVNGASVRRLPRRIGGAGAIGALGAREGSG